MLRLVENITNMRYASLLELWISVILGFAAGYFLLTAFVPKQGLVPLAGLPWFYQLFDSIYFSVVTATTVGYGDIQPLGFSKVLAGGEAILAFFIFAAFVAKLVSHRQEIALHQIHKLTFEDVFANTREGLFIIRKDFDHVITQTEHEGGIAEHAWENLLIAYREGQTLMEQIPDFYDAEHQLYTIDSRREQLLKESVHRTLHRINQMLDVFAELQIDWTAHAASATELQNLVIVVERIMPLWREKSPYDEIEPFEEILMLNRNIHQRLQKALPRK